MQINESNETNEVNESNESNEVRYSDVLEIEKELDRLYERVGDMYLPRSPERREYRKCGIKQIQDKRLFLRIEEALFEIKNVPRQVLAKYAKINRYEFFFAYAQIRSAGWILIPIKGHKYRYKLYSPDKNFNRKKCVSDSAFLQFVSADENVCEYLSQCIGDKNGAFAVTDGEAFLVLSVSLFRSAQELALPYIARVERRR